MIKITDEQHNELCDKWGLILEPHDYEVLYGILTKEQRISLVEEIGLGVVKWKEFDSEDESTWPEDGQSVITNLGQSQFLPHLGGFISCIAKQGMEITHWCELPKPPKEE